MPPEDVKSYAYSIIFLVAGERCSAHEPITDARDALRFIRGLQHAGLPYKMEQVTHYRDKRDAESRPLTLRELEGIVGDGKPIAIENREPSNPEGRGIYI